jgi:PhnB protein
MGKLYRNWYAVLMPTEVTPIPPGFHSLTPHLNVKGAAAYIDFLKRAFDAEEMHRSPGPGGKLMHVTVRIGDSMLMFADDFCEEFHMPPFATGNLPFVINLYTPDADVAWERALAAGCQVKFPLADQFWGDRYGQVADPFGFVWAISTRKEILTPEQMQERAAKAFGGGHS